MERNWYVITTVVPPRRTPRITRRGWPLVRGNRKPRLRRLGGGAWRTSSLACHVVGSRGGGGAPRARGYSARARGGEERGETERERGESGKKTHVGGGETHP